VATSDGFAPRRLERFPGVSLGSNQRQPHGALSGLDWSWASDLCLSFSYWCNGFLDRANARWQSNPCQRLGAQPGIATLPKMLFPFLVIVPGMIAIQRLCPKNGRGRPISCR